MPGLTFTNWRDGFRWTPPINCTWGIERKASFTMVFDWPLSCSAHPQFIALEEEEEQKCMNQTTVGAPSEQGLRRQLVMNPTKIIFKLFTSW